MSLKAFHIFFIAVSIILTLGFAVWLFESYTRSENSMMMVGSILSIIIAVGLGMYGVRFLKKLKNVSYL
ncbi:MAG: hypothetical protein HY277_01130 [Ignavibacteriales bacterium]|nr:hypothetical protein [Ignavibacteriales bacterium]